MINDINYNTACIFSYTLSRAIIIFICPSPHTRTYSVSTSLARTVTTLNGADNDHTDTLRLTMDQLILTSTTLTTTNTNIDNNYVSNMLNVFNSILTDPSFIGQSLIVQSMKSFAYSLVEEDTCPASNTEVLKTHSRTAFVLEALKIRPLLLASRQFMSSDSADYIQFPAQSLTTSQTVS